MIETMFLRFLIYNGSILACLLGILFCWKVLSNPYNFEKRKKGKNKGDLKND